MKIKLSALPDEEQDVTAVVKAIKAVLPDVKARRSVRHPPFTHIYLTSKKPESPCQSSENSCIIPTDMV